MKSLFSPQTAASISRSRRGDVWQYSVPSRDTGVNVFSDLNSLLRPKNRTGLAGFIEKVVSEP